MDKKYLMCTSIILIIGDDLKSFLIKKGDREVLFEFDTIDEAKEAILILNQTKKPILKKNLVSKRRNWEKFISLFVDLKILIEFEFSNSIHPGLIVNSDFEKALDNYFFSKENSFLDIFLIKKETNVKIVGFNKLGLLIEGLLKKIGFLNVSLVNYSYLKNKSLSSENRDLVSFDDFIKLDNKCSLIIIADEYSNTPSLLYLNHLFFQKRWSFLPLFVLSGIGYAGPLIIPGKTSCLNCLFSRMKETGTDFNFLDALEEEIFEWQSQLIVHPSLLATLAHLFTFQLTSEISRIKKNYSNGKKELLFTNYCNKIMEVDLHMLKISERRIVRKINCHCCLELMNKQKQIFDFSSEESVS